MSMAKNIKRTKLSDSQLKSEMLSLFNGGITGKSDCYGKIRIKHTLARDRFFRMYDVCHSEWSKIKERADTDVTVQAAETAAKIGLKSKLDKQIHLQNQIDCIQADIDRGIIEDYVMISGALELVNKIMNAESKAYLRKTMKELYAELNKMEGDYAAKRIELKDVTDLNKLPIEFE